MIDIVARCHFGNYIKTTQMLPAGMGNGCITSWPYAGKRGCSCHPHPTNKTHANRADSEPSPTTGFTLRESE